MDHAGDWVGDVLGNLAADTDNDARLRETRRVFLGCGSSYKLAAEELIVHFDTVKYRVGRALARRGRPITNDSPAVGRPVSQRPVLARLFIAASASTSCPLPLSSEDNDLVDS